MDEPVPGLAPEAQGELESALATLEQAMRQRYYDADSDATAAAEYYEDSAPEHWGLLVTTTHRRRPRYRPSLELYPWVDLQPDRTLTSLYTGHSFDPAELIRADFAVLAQRHRRAAELAPLAEQDEEEIAEQLEERLPYNCEHVVPQSWFGKAEPMRGDLHHLFACESRCNSFRGNTPFAELSDWPAVPAPPDVDPMDPGDRRDPPDPLRLPDVLPLPEVGPEPDLVLLPEAVREDCGKIDTAGFEPNHGKGAAARAVFYVALRYPAVIDDAEMDPARYDELLDWHADHPVELWERHRNAAIQARQGNRNPFIDHPDRAADLVALIRGEATSPGC